MSPLANHRIRVDSENARALVANDPLVTGSFGDAQCATCNKDLPVQHPRTVCDACTPACDCSGADCLELRRQAARLLTDLGMVQVRQGLSERWPRIDRLWLQSDGSVLEVQFSERDFDTQVWQLSALTWAELSASAQQLVMAKVRAAISDRCDACDVQLDERDTCPACHAYHGDPCPRCERRGYHVDGCARSDA